MHISFCHDVYISMNRYSTGVVRMNIGTIQFTATIKYTITYRMRLGVDFGLTK